MLERLRDVNRHRDAFLRNIIGQHVASLFELAAAESVDGREFHKNSIEELFPEYFEADKQLGQVDDERLMLIGAMCFAYAKTDSVPLFFKIDALELGSSALQEAAFVQAVDSHNAIETVDARLEIIEAADVMLQIAMKSLPPESSKFHRLALKRIFTRVHQDITSGDITDDTVTELHALLEKQKADTEEITNKRQAYGLRGEIETLQHYWQNYTRNGRPVALPATLRGNSGHTHREQTHDIDLIRQKKIALGSSYRQ